MRTIYSLLSLNGHLYKTDTSVKWTLRVGPCLSLLPLFDSPSDGHLSKTDTYCRSPRYPSQKELTVILILLDLYTVEALVSDHLGNSKKWS